MESNHTSAHPVPDDATRRSSVDGVSGEYRPPVELDIPRLRATRGAAGLDAPELMDHHEHLAAVREGRLGSVHSWELVTSVDGPGTRMTVFMAGCELRCQYCHNPDTWFTAKGQPILLEDLVKRVARYRGVFKASGGGLTVSGGEPMMQAAFVGNLLHEVHAMGVHTCIDTCGFLGAHVTDEMLDDIDLVLLDIKSGDPATYKEVTGQELEPTLRFARRLAERGTETWIRYVLVPGLTDDVDNVQAVADFVATMGNVSRVEVLPFHQMGRDKYAALGIDYKLANTSPPDAELLERVRGQFRAKGLTTY